MAHITSSTVGKDAANMYRVGDYVYFENSSTSPYAIRRIDELNKNQSGQVEAKVMCFYRRSELPQSLIPQADKDLFGDDCDGPAGGGKGGAGGAGGGGGGGSEPDSDDEDDNVETPDAIRRRAEREAFKLREVFLSRQMETLPATLIRGKCSVTLLSEVETPASYTGRSDAFFYSLVYDPHQKSLVADRGEIRIGSSYQATVAPLLDERQREADREDAAALDEMIWDPRNCLDKEDVEKYLTVAKSVGTFARALDCSSSMKQPSLHVSASSASRDVTIFHAHEQLHKHKYNLADAIRALVPTTGPVLCRDELEDWSASEANLFNEGLEKHGKEFDNIKRDYLPWKRMRNMIEYFFMWKTSDRYIQHKKLKAVENESKLKQVYVPSYTNKSTRLQGPNGEIIVRGRDCDAYPNMTKYSWSSYKQYGKFTSATSTDDYFILDKSFLTSNTAARLAHLRPGLIIEPDLSGGGKDPKSKTKAALYLRTTPLSRAARRMCDDMVSLRKSSRNPVKPIDMKAIKSHVRSKLPTTPGKTIRQLNSFQEPKRSNTTEIVKKLGQLELDEQEWLVLTPKDKLPQPKVFFFPRPKQRADGSFIFVAPDSVSVSPCPVQRQSMLYKKRAYEDVTATVAASAAAAVAAQSAAAPAKMQRITATGELRNFVPSKARMAALARGGGHVKASDGSWIMDAPDDVYYRATPKAKKTRRGMVRALRRAARKPFKKVLGV